MATRPGLQSAGAVTLAHQADLTGGAQGLLECPVHVAPAAGVFQFVLYSLHMRAVGKPEDHGAVGHLAVVAVAKQGAQEEAAPLVPSELLEYGGPLRLQPLF